MRGRVGAGQAAVTSFAIPIESVGWWLERLGARGLAVETPVGRFDERVLALRDPDGMLLELVGSARYTGIEGWAHGSVPAEHAIRGVHGVTLWTDGPAAATEEVLTGLLGFTAAGEHEGTRRFCGDAPLGSVVDLRRTDGFWRGVGGVGTVHHVAFRAADEARQLDVRGAVEAAGLQITPVVDRQYFKSVYFREPGGVLFEIATDSPGFLWDETEAELGTSLKLPSWLEKHREEIVRELPSLFVGGVEVAS
jgi:glyoxalase family protein